ncbi:MAG: hypothetical protein EBZ74_07220 [Planctomycetia bacterium]|nr:hypothetical protein [Planctomycetia bacterium]
MISDPVDQAFLARFIGPTAAPAESPPPVAGGEPRAEPLPSDPVVARLLAKCPGQWTLLAERVEAAWAGGDRLVAIAGRTRGEGRSTLVRGLAHVLRARGRCSGFRTLAAGDRIAADPLDRPALVDAGIWFPPGPVHRGRLARAASGCQAAVLVRRASEPPCPAHEAALETLGIRVLGEVETFSAADPREGVSS